MRWYMHTIRGLPAHWSEEHGELFVAGGRYPATLHRDLRTIRRQQRASDASRARAGFYDSAREYGYVLVEAPDARR